MNAAVRVAGCPRGRSGLTVVELLVVITVIGLLSALIIPAALMAREASRRAVCANNLHQLGVALASHAADHSRYKPRASPFSPHIALLPYLEQQALFASINVTENSSANANQTAFATAVAVFLCPSDNSPHGGPSRFNYAFCSGYGAQTHSRFNGAFIGGTILGPDKVRDGLSSTAAVSEVLIGTGPLDPVPRDLRRIALAVEPPLSAPAEYEAFVRSCDAISRYNGNPESRFQRGGSWSFNALGSITYTHDLPPNRNACHNGQGDLGNGAWSASSEHSRGVHLLHLDGHCRFVKSSVNSRIWRHLSTIQGGEPIGED